MTPEQFAYWMQGFMEISDPKTLDEKQVQIIKDHLATIFKKETPNRNAKELSELLVGPAQRTRLYGPATNKCVICGQDHGGLPCTRLAVSC